MGNRLTGVPDRPVPPLRGWERHLVPAADLVMRAMLSRPSTGSLAVTWVTPGTLLLAAVLVVTGGAAGVLGLVDGVAGGRTTVIVLGVVALLLAAVALPLAIVGAAQRRESHPTGGRPAA